VGVSSNVACSASFADLIPRDDQLTPFAVDVAEARRGRGDPFQTAVDHAATVAPMNDRVNGCMMVGPLHMNIRGRRADRAASSGPVV